MPPLIGQAHTQNTPDLPQYIELNPCILPLCPIDPDVYCLQICQKFDGMMYCTKKQITI